jgi:Transglycosylase
MIHLLATLIVVPVVLAIEAIFIVLVAAGAAWWLPVLPVAVLALLLVRVVVIALKPGLIGVNILVALVIAALVGTYSLVAATLADGVVETGHIQDELRQSIEHSRAIQLLDVDGRLIGILPAIFDPTRADAPYLAIPMRAEDVPPMFWACAKFLEDKDLDEPWHILGIDFRRLGSAVLSKFIGSRAGASTLAEMVDRSIGGTPPQPRQSLLSELPRKLTSWRRLPGLADLYPTEADLKAMVATHLTLMTPGPGARFGGGEIHGVALAAAVLGKRPADLTEAEQALLAAAINLPLLIGGKATWRKPRERADYCLAHVPLGDGFDRAHAREELAAIKPARGPLRHPAARATDLLGGRMAALTRELTAIVGPDWPQRVTAVRLSLRQPLPGLPEEMENAAHEVERRQAGRLAVPLWSGDGAALVYGVVADSNGEILAAVSNTDLDMGVAKIAIGSVGKIVAALALAPGGTLDAATRSAFARSDSIAVMARLRRVPAADIARAFAALGWALPPGQSPKRDAVYGAVELEPDRVLRAIIALNDLLWIDRTESVAIAQMVLDVSLSDGTVTKPATASLPVNDLRAFLTAKIRTYVTSVLAAPLATGTMRAVGAMLKAESAIRVWGKSGTADVASGGFGVSQTRALWNVGGATIAGRRLAFVLVVVSRDAKQPLGFVQSPALAPLTVALLRHAINQLGSHTAQTIARLP